MSEQNGSRCTACDGWFVAASERQLCQCAEGARTDRGAEIRYKRSIGQCFATDCEAPADVDGWCDEHSVQFQTYGTHHAVGSYGPGSAVPAELATAEEDCVACDTDPIGRPCPVHDS